MKKFKILGFIILLALFILLLFGSCRKTRALESELDGVLAEISARDSDQYGIVFVYNVAKKDVPSDVGIVFFYTSTPQSYNYEMYIDISNNGYMKIRDGGGNVLEEILLNTRLLQIQIVFDVNAIYLVVFELDYNVQYAPSYEPAISGINRQMKTRYLLPLSFQDNWESGSLFLTTTATFTYQGIPNYLLNYSYITSAENSANNSITLINNWVDSLLYNYVIENKLLSVGYNYGYDYGYEEGKDDGYDVGYEEGKDDGYDIGYYEGLDDGYELGEMSQDAWQSGYDVGYQDGEETQTAYQDGYRDGQAGETAISPVFRIISDVFGAIGAIMAVELVPHVPLGLFILVPLFFAALGLILWIWRRN